MLNSSSFPKIKLSNLKCQLNSNEYKLEQAIAEKGKYLKCITYEKKVKAIIGITGLAQGLINNWDNFSPAQLKEYTLAIAKSSDRVANLINDTLDLAHIHHEEFSLHSTSLNFSQMIKEKFQNDNNIKFISNSREDLFLNGDEYLISRLLGNLISSISEDQVNFVEVRSKASASGAAYIETTINYNFGCDTAFDKNWSSKLNTTSNTLENFEFNKDVGLVLAHAIVELHKGKIVIEGLTEKTRNLIFTLPI